MSGPARHHRADVVAGALRVLDEHGLESWTMRRVAAALDVQASALYHHFPRKQELLAAVAESILADRRRGSGPEDVVGLCEGLRDAMLAYRDGAEVVATTWSFGLGARAPYDDLVAALAAAGADRAVTEAGARTLLHFTFGFVGDEQTHLQAESAGALAPTSPRLVGDSTQAYRLGVSLILDGVRARIPR